MPGNPFNNPTMDMMYSDAVLGLMNGCLMPWDKQVLAAAPIPSAVIEPYMEKEIPDVRESMRLTYETMVVWIEEAKKVNYFSKRFVQLSKMIMNGVTTMGRGLITLHARGEEPAGVPMSIQDLIGVASYHFRKSHLGVLQTVRSHPEISERLLMNQISWNNMLMRLFKTKEKLESGIRCQVSGVRNQVSGVRNQVSGGSDQVSGICGQESGRELPGNDALLPANEEKVSGVSDQLSCGQLPGGDFDAFKVFGPEDRGFSEPNALREPGALAAPRALRAMRNAECGVRSRTSEGSDSEANSKKPLNEEKVSGVRDSGTRIEEQGSGINEEGRMKNEENDTDESENGNPKPASDFITNDEEILKAEEVPDGNSDPSSFLLHNSSLDEDSSLDDGTPPYLKILQNVYARSGPTDDGKLNFTFDEVCYLAADPDFGRIYPGTAEQMRALLDRLDTG